MNEAQARSLGYRHHGAFGRNKEDIKARAKELRSLGNKAIVVNITAPPYSRGHHGMGYGIYWIESEENKRIRELGDLRRMEVGLISDRQELTVKISNIDNRLKDIRMKIYELEGKS